MNTSQELLEALSRHREQVETVILSRQDPITGLLPASTAVNTHGDYTDAWVRDNVYSILSVWGLALAYRNYRPDDEYAVSLRQSVVKLMRGLLGAMMRQSDHVERFKYTLDPFDALHAKYGTHTGLAVVGDGEWGHLQIDATSLYLLMLAQMTSSGLQIVYTVEEVHFVQNLIHYISRAYCTADYGIWERGNKINHGQPEINCSSVGMAKAALEVLDGFNLFGNVAGQSGVLHVVSADVSRARFTLQSLLPRESLSKETDAALLSIVGYPAYAVEDICLLSRTRDKVVKKLAGRYGCKRFLLDGHQNVLEDPDRLHYESDELRTFEDIESEWPLFFTYFYLDALMRGERSEADMWREKLRPLFIDMNGETLLPELYYVPEERIEAERAAPGSQERLPNDNVPLVWAQSLYMLGEMLFEGILHPSDIDPLRRRERPGRDRDTTPLVSIIAQNTAVKRELLDLGYPSETLEEVAPITVMHAAQLTQLQTKIGEDIKLGLSGRPPLITRTISTSRLYKLAGQPSLFLPYHFNPKEFYLNYDGKLLAAHFRSSLAFLAEHWDQPGQPIVPFLVREEMLRHTERDDILSLLHDITAGESNGTRLRSGPLRQLLNTASTERIDRLNGFVPSPMRFPEEPECRLGPDAARVRCLPEEMAAIEQADDAALTAIVRDDADRMRRTLALLQLKARHGAGCSIDGMVLCEQAESLYKYAAACQEWAIVRRLAELCGKHDDRLEDVLLEIIIRQKRLAVGRAYSEQAIFSSPKESLAMVRTIEAFCGNSPAESVLTQEIILHLGQLIRNRPELFEHMLTLRTWYFVQLLVSRIARRDGLSMADAYEQLLAEPPHAVFELLLAILESFGDESRFLQQQENLHASGMTDMSTAPMPHDEQQLKAHDWMQWRRDAGLIGRYPPKFYKNIWYMLQQCPGIVIGDKYNVQNRIGSEQTLDTTAGERSFELRVETLFQNIQSPEYRQLNIEAIDSLVWLFRQNPDFQLNDDLVLDVLIGHAVRLRWQKNGGTGDYNDARADAWDAFYRLPPAEAESAFVEALMFLLGDTEIAHRIHKESL